MWQEREALGRGGCSCHGPRSWSGCPPTGRSSTPPPRQSAPRSGGSCWSTARRLRGADIQLHRHHPGGLMDLGAVRDGLIEPTDTAEVRIGAQPGGGVIAG
jgi:hypothetical protein